LAARAVPTQSEVERAFADAMQAAGFNPGPIEAGTPGFVRFDAPGDKKGKRNGFYKLALGDWPTGWFGDWKDPSGQVQWAWHESQGITLSDADRRKVQQERARLKAEASQARELRQMEVAEEASKRWGKSSADVEGHPYLDRKQIEVPRGLRVHTAGDGTALLTVPMYAFDMAGKTQLIGLQHIGPDGDKRFMASQRVEGGFFSIKGDPAMMVVCEGVATAFSIWQATGLSVVAAFNAGNLIQVVKDLMRWRSHATLLIAADNDEIAPLDWAEKGQGRPWVNAGVVKGEAAAKLAACRWIVPIFTDGPGRDRTDFNDLWVREGKQAVAGQVLGAYRSIEAETSEPGAEIVDIERTQDESWRGLIPMTSTGSLDGNNVEGVAVMIQHHRLLKDRLRYNQFTKEIELDGNGMEDYHVAQFRRIMHQERLKGRKADVQDEMQGEARRNGYDPLVEYLTTPVWDLMPRLDTFCSKYLGTEQTEYTRAVGRAFLIGAVARALDPGCKNDTMLVLEGPQGIGKSTAARYLFGDRFFTDNLPDFHSKDSFQQLQGSWCIEVAELSALSKAEVKDVKQFLSRLVDKFRAPYERLPMSIKRRSVFIGTVNPEDVGYLRDPTGNRRFWPIECGAIDTDAILLDRDQIWAEAVIAFRSGEKWFLTDEAAEQAREEQAKRGERHPWEELIRSYVAAHGKDRLTIGEVLTDILKLLPDKQTLQAARGAGSAMRGLGWIPRTERLYRGAEPVKVFYPPEGFIAEPDTRDFERLAFGDDDDLPTR
jgi:putative DNA primase/helicase